MQKSTIDRLQSSRPLSVDFTTTLKSESTSSSVESSLTSSPTVERLSESPEPSIACATPTTIPRGRGILVTIPTARSSSVPPTPRAYSISSSIVDRSSNQSLNVKFAPLPELAPRRRKSSAPLGIASRGQMMRRRRGIPEPQPPLPEPPEDHRDSWTHQELESQLRVQHSTPTHEIDDPFSLIGKKIKGAWRRVNSKKVAEDSARTGSPCGERRIILATIEPNESEAGEEGRVWEEEVGADFPRGLGQTDTIMESEAEKYSWAGGKPPPDP
ncbi:hypothetical protein C8J56DRAFT_491606 [Mycena floridula]|nr:hypothetical protein C8J56DRAFT_491606 [Mycena floridula]